MTKEQKEAESKAFNSPIKDAYYDVEDTIEVMLTDSKVVEFEVDHNCELLTPQRMAHALCGRREEEDQRIPVIIVPAFGEVLACSLRKTGVVKNDLCASAPWSEFELDDGIDAGSPICGTPGLDDALAR